jgi:dihydroflavonol-4-reductase
MRAVGMATLVTGATGLMGNNVVRALLDQGRSVRVLVRETSDPRPLEGLDTEVVRGDIREAEAVRRACAGVDGVVHAAGWVHIGWTGAELAREVNVEGTRCVARAAQEAGVRMIHVSSMNALGIGKQDQPADEESPRVGQVPCPYIVTKRESEEVVRQCIEEGLDAVIVNPGFMLGPWDWKPSSGRMVLELSRRFMPVAPRGGCSACDVRDVAQGILAAREKGRSGQNYILAGENLRYLDLWKIVAEVTGRRAPWFRPGPVAPWIGGHLGDLKARLTGREPDLNSAAIRVSWQFHYYSCRRAEEELGYRYRPAREAVEASWAWFREYGYAC